MPQPREWGEFRSANLWVEADNVSIEGIDFRFGLGSGVRIWRGRNVTIQNCVFSGAMAGVSGDGRAKEIVATTDSAQVTSVSGITLTRCLYQNYPQHEWLRDWLSWDEIYAQYASNSLARVRAKQTTITHCLAAHVADAVQASSPSDEPADIAIAKNW
ncbi:MAG: hypothetical protein KDA58_10675, partial [Planctomycetaceae bacterium]|nr:hypothetical protein [Planctomycetaceae bacterium]